MRPPWEAWCLLAAIALAAVALSGCEDRSAPNKVSDAPAPDAPSGDAAAEARAATGGASGTGGLAGAGGVIGTGGAPGMGGAPGTGGAPGVGGAPGTGGAPGIGGAGGTGGAGGGSTGPACTADGWCWVFPLPHGNQLRAMWGSSASDVWVAGAAGTLMHWDGTRFTTTLGSTSQTWLGIWGASASEVWLVGKGGTIQRFDGASWQPVPFPTTGDLGAIWGTGTGTIYVVAAQDGIWRSDGGGPFTKVVDDIDLNAIDGAAPDDVWAVGPGSSQHWDGKAWTDIALFDPETGVFSPAVNGVVAVGSGEAWASSDDIIDPLFHYDGVSGQWAGTPVSLRGYDLFGIRRVGSEIWAVGQWGAYHWTAAAGWVFDPVLTPEPTLMTVWGDGPDDVWAAGNGGAVLRRAADGVWITVAGTTGFTDYESVSGTASDDVWAAGQQRVGHFDGLTWSETRTATVGAPAGFGGVSAQARDDVWAFTLSGSYDTALFHSDGAAWSAAGTLTNFRASAIWGAAGDDIWLVSSQGGARHYDGQTWNQIAFGDLQAIAGSGSRDVWAVGDSFGTAHWDGQAWSAVAGGAGDGDDWLTTVCVGSDGQAWTGGSNAQLWSWMPGGAGWSQLGGPFTQWVNACTAVPGAMWAASASGPVNGGQLARWDGSSFHSEQAGNGGGLHALWSTGSSLAGADVWAWATTVSSGAPPPPEAARDGALEAHHGQRSRLAMHRHVLTAEQRERRRPCCRLTRSRGGRIRPAAPTAESRP
jgi:hypothetical protein